MIAVNVINKKPESITFVMDGCTESLANALRRTILKKVPTLAIEDVAVTQNNSALFNEVLAHRLGLVPLKTDLKSYSFKNECKCKGAGCARCEAKYALKKTGPGNVYSGDLVSSDPGAQPVHEKMILTKLLTGQEVTLEATAILGTGEEHAKWSPGHAFYQKYPKLDLGECGNAEEVAKSCPRDVLTSDGKKVSVKPGRLEYCHLCKACEDKCDNGKIKVGTEKDKIIFTIESWGQLSPEEIMNKALEIIETELQQVKESI